LIARLIQSKGLSAALAFNPRFRVKLKKKTIILHGCVRWQGLDSGVLCIHFIETDVALSPDLLL